MITLFFVIVDDDNNGSTTSTEQYQHHNSSSRTLVSNDEWSDNTIVTYLFFIVVIMGLFSALVGYLCGRYSSLTELKQEVIAEMNAVEQQKEETANHTKMMILSSQRASNYTVLPVDLNSPNASLYAFNSRGGWSRKPLRKTETFAGSKSTPGGLTTPPRTRQQGDIPNSSERDERIEWSHPKTDMNVTSPIGVTTTTTGDHQSNNEIMNVSHSSMGSFDLTVSDLHSPSTPPSSSYQYRPTTPAEDRYGKTKAYLRTTMDNHGTPLSMSLFTPEKVRNHRLFTQLL